MFIPFNITSKVKKRSLKPSTAQFVQQEEAVNRVTALEHDFDVLNEQLKDHRQILKASVKKIDDQIIPMVLRFQPKVKIKN